VAASFVWGWFGVWWPRWLLWGDVAPAAALGLLAVAA
jgi:hypothetical protein